jgi:hypothetical protein
MKIIERLALLRLFACAVEDAYESPEQGVSWARSVDPLLDYNPTLHEAFDRNAQLLATPSSNAEVVNQLLAIIREAISELQSGLSAPAAKSSAPSLKFRWRVWT